MYNEQQTTLFLPTIKNIPNAQPLKILKFLCLSFVSPLIVKLRRGSPTFCNAFMLSITVAAPTSKKYSLFVFDSTEKRKKDCVKIVNLKQRKHCY